MCITAPAKCRGCVFVGECCNVADLSGVFRPIKTLDCMLRSAQFEREAQMNNASTRSSIRRFHRLRALALLAVNAGVAALTSASATHAQWTTPPVTAPGLQYPTFESAAAAATASFHVDLPPQNPPPHAAPKPPSSAPSPGGVSRR